MSADVASKRPKTARPEPAAPARVRGRPPRLLKVRDSGPQLAGAAIDWSGWKVSS